MKKILFAICILVPMLSFTQGYNSKGSSHRGYNTPYTQQESRPSSWSGSGIALASRYVATNNHVVEGATNLYIFFPETEEQYKAEVIKTNPDTDLAIIKISDQTFKGFAPIKYGFKQAIEDVGVDVFVLGYPLITTMGTEVKLTTGVVSSKSGYQGDKTQYQISAPVQPGNSGGPLFNDKGELIGIVSAKHTGAENVSYGVKLSHLGEMAESIPEINMNRSSQLVGQSLSEKVKAVQPCTVMILADNNSGQRQPSAAAQPTAQASTKPTAGTYPIRVNSPEIAKPGDTDAHIDGIEITAQYTAIHMSWTNTQYSPGWYCIDKASYIIDKTTGKKYTIKDTDNCAFSPAKTSIDYGETKYFVLYFPSIPANTTSIDLCEPGNSKWKFYGIDLQ